MTINAPSTGFHAWIVYSLVGLVFGITCHREQLPVTMKSCFLPLIGDRVYGWMGDLIDSVSIVSTLFGVCVTLGIGARQVNSGLSLLFGEYVSMSVTTQVNLPSSDIASQCIVFPPNKNHSLKTNRWRSSS